MAICPADRAVLHARIASRVDAMLDAGLVEEVRALYSRGDLHLELPAMRAVGYRQVWAHMRGEYDLKHTRERCIQATRQLAKRQLTWLRGWSGLRWIYTDAAGFASSKVEDVEILPEKPLQVALKYLADATIDIL